MIILKRVLYAVFILALLTFVALSVYVKYYARDALQGALHNALKRDVAFSGLAFRFPLDIKAYHVKIGHRIEGKKFFEADEITARFSLTSLLRGKLIFNKVEVQKPVVVIDRSLETVGKPAERRYGIVIPPPKTGEISERGEDGRGQSPSAGVSIEKFILKNGQFQYVNRLIDKDFSFALKDVAMKVGTISFPFAAGRSAFDITGRLVKEGNPLSGSSVKGGGWVDMVGRNMDAHVEVVEADGTVGMTAHAVSQNNDMNVEGEVQFKNILVGAVNKDTSELSAVNDLISSTLSSAGVEIGAQFSFRTKMDDFRPEQVSFKGNVVAK